jgi:hypothetical protein
VAEEEMIRQGWAEPAQLAGWRNEIQRQIDEVVAQVQREPAPDPYTQDWSAISSRSFSETHETR